MLLNVYSEFLPNSAKKIAQILSEGIFHCGLCKNWNRGAKKWTKLSDRIVWLSTKEKKV